MITVNKDVELTVDDLRQVWSVLTEQERAIVQSDVNESEHDDALANLGVQLAKCLAIGQRELGQNMRMYIEAIEGPTWDAYTAEELRGITGFLSEMFMMSDDSHDAAWNLQHPEG